MRYSEQWGSWRQEKNSGFRPEAGREGRLLFGGWHPSVWKEKTVLEVEGGEGYTTSHGAVCMKMSGMVNFTCVRI